MDESNVIALESIVDLCHSLQQVESKEENGTWKQFQWCVLADSLFQAS